MECQSCWGVRGEAAHFLALVLGADKCFHLAVAVQRTAEALGQVVLPLLVAPRVAPLLHALQTGVEGCVHLLLTAA